MSYIGLGSRVLTAATDTSGLNAGNYSSQFAAAAMSVNVPYFEVYSMSVTGLGSVATITVYVNGKVRSTAKLLGNAEWDPNQPILLTPADELLLAWDFGTGTPPSATIWLRYDPAVNQGLM